MIQQTFLGSRQIFHFQVSPAPYLSEGSHAGSRKTHARSGFRSGHALKGVKGDSEGRLEVVPDLEVPCHTLTLSAKVSRGAENEGEVGIGKPGLKNTPASAMAVLPLRSVEGTSYP